MVGMVTVQRPAGLTQNKHESMKAKFGFNADFAVNQDVNKKQNIKGRSRKVYMVASVFSLHA